MGIISLNLDEWLEPDEYYYRELLEKEALLANQNYEVFQSKKGSQLAQQEVLDLIIDYMNTFHSELVRIDGDKIFIDGIKRNFSRKEFAEIPLNLAGRLVQEDLCLMAPGDTGYTLEAASLCFPSRWRLIDKIGKRMVDIHSPVPDYEDKLARPVDRFFDKLDINKPVWRVNWSLTDDPDLYQPIRKTSTDYSRSINSKNAGDLIFLRCERQTLRRLPNTGWILFSIKTYVDKVSALAVQPEALVDLAHSVKNMSADMQQYKNIAPYRKQLLEYLDVTHRQCLDV
tara:strand:+ start:2133 stop:2987 length:855 start_codon:yes stop_codon:yes gene_type:complete